MRKFEKVIELSYEQHLNWSKVGSRASGSAQGGRIVVGDELICAFRSRWGGMGRRKGHSLFMESPLPSGLLDEKVPLVLWCHFGLKLQGRERETRLGDVWRIKAVLKKWFSNWAWQSCFRRPSWSAEKKLDFFELDTLVWNIQLNVLNVNTYFAKLIIIPATKYKLPCQNELEFLCEWFGCWRIVWERVSTKLFNYYIVLNLLVV